MTLKQLFKNNRIRFLYASTTINFVFGIIKCITAITISSMLFSISGLYNFALCIAKIPYLHWNKQTQKWDLKSGDVSDKRKLLLMSSIIIILGVLFATFGFKMFFTGEEVHYSEYSVYAIALCSFVKLGVSIYWIVKLKGSNQPMEYTMKLTNFADAMVSLVLTQSALLVMKGIAKSSYYDGLFGIIVGFSVIIIGIISTVLSQKKRNASRA